MKWLDGPHRQLLFDDNGVLRGTVVDGGDRIVAVVGASIVQYIRAYGADRRAAHEVAKRGVEDELAEALRTARVDDLYAEFVLLNLEERNSDMLFARIVPAIIAGFVSPRCMRLHTPAATALQQYIHQIEVTSEIIEYGFAVVRPHMRKHYPLLLQRSASWAKATCLLAGR
jgi:hypothetical protein